MRCPDVRLAAGLWLRPRVQSHTPDGRRAWWRAVAFDHRPPSAREAPDGSCELVKKPEGERRDGPGPTEIGPHPLFPERRQQSVDTASRPNAPGVAGPFSPEQGRLA